MIKSIKLTNFRNFGKKELSFESEINFIIAANASGKTNILEAIYILSLGKSFKAKLESEIIKNDKDICHIEGIFGKEEGFNLKVVLTRGFLDYGKNNIEKVQKKKLFVNNIARRQIDFAGNSKATLFLPEDIELVTGSPSKRRSYMDYVLSQIDRNYRKSLLIYEKGLRQRNKILLKIREERVSRSYLLFWNQLLIKNGAYITEKRAEFIDYCNTNESLISNSFSLSYDKSVISEGRLEQYKNEEVLAGTTLVGPHRDDFVFQKLEKSKTQNYQTLELSSFGSRGEQRLGVLWLKINEIKFIEEKTGVKPVLLLDDIFSELDHNNRKVVVDLIKDYQSIITTADKHNVPKMPNAKFQMLNL